MSDDHQLTTINPENKKPKVFNMCSMHSSAFHHAMTGLSARGRDSRGSKLATDGVPDGSLVCLGTGEESQHLSEFPFHKSDKSLSALQRAISILQKLVKSL